MHYQIFIPHKGGANLDHLRAVGLDDLLSPHDERPGCADILRGPDGNPGQLWGWPGAKDVLSFAPDSQTWEPCQPDPVRKLPAGRFWWGFGAETPTEESLRRETTFRGFKWAIADGREWLVPNVLELPESFGFDATGDVIRIADAAYKPFVDDAEWAIHQVLDVQLARGARDWKRELSVACRFLGANYRLNRELIIRLGLLKPDNVLGVLMGAVDRHRLMDLIDKLGNPEAGAATPAGSSVSGGPGD